MKYIQVPEAFRLGYNDYPFNRPERISLSPEWNWELR